MTGRSCVVLVAATLGAAAVLTSGALSGKSAGAAAVQACPAGPDFNGDRCGDLVVADPDATVSGSARAGRINVLYGAESGTGARAVIAQGQAGIAGVPEPGDRFGASVRTAQLNNDELADLVVATPTEDVGGAADAGIIQVIFGSAAGLGGGAPSLTVRQGRHGVPGIPEAGDRFGAGLAVNTTGSFQTAPVIGYGVPGEDIWTASNAGAAGLVVLDSVTGEVEVAGAISQDSPGVSGRVEAGDRFGAAVEVFEGPGGFGCPTDGLRGLTLVVGAPGEDLGAVPDAGTVHLVRDLASDVTLSQDSSRVSGVAEAGDQFGASLALTAYCEHDGPSWVTLAVGVPTEDIGPVRDAGAAHLFRTVEDEIPPPEQWSVNQNTEGVDGTAEAGDRFGAVLALGGPWREGIGEPVLISAPGEDIGAATDAGGLQVFGDLTTAPGNGDVFVSQATADEVPESGDRFGAALLANWEGLYVGVPDDLSYPTGAVHGLTWSTVFDTPTPHLLLVPGSAGIPTGASRFGAGLA